MTSVLIGPYYKQVEIWRSLLKKANVQQAKDTLKLYWVYKYTKATLWVLILP
jgi:hypothetical protein